MNDDDARRAVAEMVGRKYPRFVKVTTDLGLIALVTVFSACGSANNLANGVTSGANPITLSSNCSVKTCSVGGFQLTVVAGPTNVNEQQLLHPDAVQSDSAVVGLTLVFHNGATIPHHADPKTLRYEASSVTSNPAAGFPGGVCGAWTESIAIEPGGADVTESVCYVVPAGRASAALIWAPDGAAAVTIPL